MGFEYKIKAKLTPGQIAEIKKLLEKSSYFDRRRSAGDNLFWDFRRPENHGEIPNASLVLEDDGIYVCQWSAPGLWTCLDDLKGYLESEGIMMEIIDLND